MADFEPVLLRRINKKASPSLDAYRADGGYRALEKAVREMTSKQTGDLPQSYGLGWSTPRKPGGPFGHGGAYRTHMQVDPKRRLVLVFLVQHAGYPGKDGDRIYPTFEKAAREQFGK